METPKEIEAKLKDFKLKYSCVFDECAKLEKMLNESVKAERIKILSDNQYLINSYCINSRGKSGYIESIKIGDQDNNIYCYVFIGVRHKSGRHDFFKLSELTVTILPPIIKKIYSHSQR